MNNKKWIYLIVFGLVLNIAVGVVSGNVFFNDTDVYLHCDDNEVYKVDTTQPFSHVVVDGDYVQFNNTAFRCDFDEDVNITLLFLNELYPYGNLTILSFTYEQGNGVSLHDFNLSGFLTYTAYQVYTNNTLLDTVISDGSEGWVNFTSDILFGRVDIVWYIMICYAGCDYDPLLDEVPLNNSYHWFQPDGFWTSISVDYTEFLDVELYEYFDNGSFSIFLNNTRIIAQTFTVGTVGKNESFLLGKITINISQQAIPLWYRLSISTVNESNYPTDNYISVSNIVPNSVFGIQQLTFYMSEVLLVKGQQYAIVLETNISSDLPIAVWEAGNVPAYNGGYIYLSLDDGTTYIQIFEYYDQLFSVYGVNVSSDTVNLTFDWYNESLGDWEQYGFIPYAINSTSFVFNSNFSGIDTYIWRVHAVASDTGVTHSETYSFTTFTFSADIDRASMGVMLACTLFIIPFWLMWKRRRKKDEKKTY